MTCSWLVRDYSKTSSLFDNFSYFTCSWLFHILFTICYWLVSDLFITCPFLDHDWFFFYNFFTFLQIYKFTWITSLTLLFLTLTYFPYTTSLQVLYSHYFTLFTSLEVLNFSHSQSFKFTESNQLNGLAGLSLAPHSEIFWIWFLFEK